MIAEGVETNEQVDYLVTAGVYAIQGYVYSRPMPAGNLMRWMEEREIKTVGANTGSR